MTKNKSRYVLILVGGILWTGCLQAQESTNASGNDAEGGGGTVNYSVGQVLYNSYAESTGSVEQGVQHAYEIFTVGIEESELHSSLTVFPNPTADNLTLQINEYSNERLSYHLFDMQGKLLISKQILASQTQIDMINLPPATYFVYVVNQENIQEQSFKIIKN